MNGLKELWLRLKEPMNTFWTRAFWIFGLVGAIAGFVTELILPLLIDPEVSHELKDTLRPFYGYFLGIASAARATVAYYETFKRKKAQPEQ